MGPAPGRTLELVAGGGKHGGRKKPEVTVRFANEGAMAAKKNPTKKNGPKRSSGKKGGGRKGKKGARRRRHNPSFMSRLGHVLLVGGVAVAAGVGTLYASQKLSATHPNLAMYGVPAAGALVGAGVAAKWPTVGIGIAAGSVAAPLSVTVATRLLTPSATSGLASAARRARLRAVHMGAVEDGMGSVHMGAVEDAA